MAFLIDIVYSKNGVITSLALLLSSPKLHSFLNLQIFGYRPIYRSLTSDITSVHHLLTETLQLPTGLSKLTPLCKLIRIVRYLSNFILTIFEMNMQTKHIPLSVSMKLQ